MNLEDVLEAYKRAASHWTGCDWRIYFEGEGPNLAGVTAVEAMGYADASTGVDSERWERAARWLAHVEETAHLTEEEGRIAYGLAIAGHPGAALPHANRACELESRFHSDLIWAPFLRAVEALVDHDGFVCETSSATAQSEKETVVLPWTMMPQ